MMSKSTIRIGIFEFKSTGENISLSLCNKKAPKEQKDKITKNSMIENNSKNQKNT